VEKEEAQYRPAKGSNHLNFANTKKISPPHNAAAGKSGYLPGYGLRIFIESMISLKSGSSFVRIDFRTL
jgi:hypothetical protein